MTDLKIGHLITGPAERDAIHIAIVPLVAGEELCKGGKVRLSSTDQTVALSADYFENQAIGIIDPFLDEWGVEKGQKFWCFLFPGTVTGMRHHWQHPAFLEQREPLPAVEKWLRDFADRWHFDFNELIREATKAPSSGPLSNYVTAHGIDVQGAQDLDGEDRMFWDHLEVYTGQWFSQEHRDGLCWTCTC